MDRVAVFVDAGYLFAQGGRLLTGRPVTRGALQLDHVAAIEALAKFAEAQSKLPLLRVYWYDGTSIGPTTQHLALSYSPRVKLRLGFVNRAGQQKGVDSLIVTDMISLARNCAMAEAVLLSGDEDIRVGVQQAQEFGCRVHLLGIQPSRGSQSGFLVQEADESYEWGKKELSAFLSIRQGPPPAPASAAPPQGQSDGTATSPATPDSPSISRQRPVSEVSIFAALKEVAQRTAAEIPQAELLALVTSMRGGRFHARLMGAFSPGAEPYLPGT